MERWKTSLLRSGAALRAAARKFDFPEEAVRRLESVFPLCVSPHYLSLIREKGDPIWLQCIPDLRELEGSPALLDDPLGEETHVIGPGVVKRYPDRCMLYVSNDCAMHCRFCTRKRLFRHATPVSELDLDAAIDTIRRHPEIRDVLVSGGDPLLLDDDRLDDILARLRAIPHVEIIRIGTRVPCALPERVTPRLARMLRRHAPLFVNVHFNHPRELAPEAVRALGRLADAGIPLGSQTVLLRGVNDDPDTLRELFTGLLKARVRPYYLFQCDLVYGTEHFRVPIDRGLDIMRALRCHVSGLAIPHYVVDLPRGKGKVPLSPNYLVRRDGSMWTFRNYLGERCEYPDVELQGADFSIRCDHPGGNISVLGIDEKAGVVRLAPDMRDSSDRWFQWDFTVSGAAGRTLRFQFPNGWTCLSTLGPAISRDGGRTWAWLHPDGSRHEPGNAFDYAFRPGENETRFAKSFPYVQRDWDAFTARWRDGGDVRFGVLCPSQSGRRDTELLRVPCRGEASWLFVAVARQHACETTGDSVLEGVVEELLSGSPEGEWIRDSAECVFVPFMDKDGVEDGDQGKNRIPHDHNRDYLAGLYTSVRALKALVEAESRGRRLVFLDLHSPYIRSVSKSQEHDHAYSFGCPDPEQDAHWNEFRRNWAEAQRGGALVYDGAFDVPAGVGHDRNLAKDRERGLVGARAWAQSLPGCFLATTCEFGYSLCGGVFSYEAGRELGRSLFKAVVRTMRSHPA